jgi:hypothetical protein
MAEARVDAGGLELAVGFGQRQWREVAAQLDHPAQSGPGAVKGAGDCAHPRGEGRSRRAVKRGGYGQRQEQQELPGHKPLADGPAQFG